MCDQKKIAQGYYVSAFCSIDPLGNILNHALRHDQNISLWYVNNDNNVELCHHWELERISGIKHHQAAFFSENDFVDFLKKLLKRYGLAMDNVKGIIGMNQLSKYGANQIVLDECEISYHSICHLFASLFLDSDLFYNENIIGLAIDGGPDVELSNNFKYCYAGSYSIKGKIEYFPVSSPAILWETASKNFGVSEGTLMALASASLSKSYYQFEHLEKAATAKDLHYAKNIYFYQLYNEIMDYSTDDIGIKFNFYDNRFSEHENKVSMLMKIIQKISIILVEKEVERIIHKFNISPSDTCLCIGGGYGLNCPTNTYLSIKYGFKRQMIIPCLNDGGQAIGMGIKYFYDTASNIHFRLENAYYGDSSCEMDESFLDYVSDISSGYESFVSDISAEPVIWFNGRSEIGPRALGHRSILGDPRKLETKDCINRIKKREWWRPVAPIILSDQINKWFHDSFDSPYMLNNFVIFENKADEVPAILHLDHTARVQTVDESNDDLYKILKMFFEITGVPILCNTSLNDKGEPIINNINEAINFALRKKIATVYYNGKRIKLKNADAYKEKNPLKREDEIFTKYREDRKICDTINPFGMGREYYYDYKALDELKQYDITNKKDFDILMKVMKKINKYAVQKK